MPNTLSIDNTEAVKNLTVETNAELAKAAETTTPTDSAPVETETSETPTETQEPTTESALETPQTTEVGEAEKTVPLRNLTAVAKEKNELKQKLGQLQRSYDELLARQGEIMNPQPTINPTELDKMDAVTYAQHVADLAAEKARTAIQVERDISRQEQEAFEAYPELNPDSPRYNATFEESVSGLIIHNRKTNQQDPSKWISAREAADQVAKLGEYFKSRGAQQALEEVKAKSGAIGTPTGGKVPSISPEDMSLEELEATLPKTDKYFKSAVPRK